MATRVYPNDVADSIQLSWNTYRKTLRNLGWAVGCNAATLPLAADPRTVGESKGA